jgi:hypothetical protein
MLPALRPPDAEPEPCVAKSDEETAPIIAVDWKLPVAEQVTIFRTHK